MWPGSRTTAPGAGSSPYGADSSKQGGQNQRNCVLVYIFTSRRSTQQRGGRWSRTLRCALIEQARQLWLQMHGCELQRRRRSGGGRKRRQWQREWSVAGRQTGKIWWSGHLTPCFYKAAHVLIEANHVDHSYRWHGRASRCRYKRVCVHVL